MWSIRTGTAQRSAGSQCDTGRASKSGHGIRGPAVLQSARRRCHTLGAVTGRESYIALCKDLCAVWSAASIRSGDVSGRGPVGEYAAWDRLQRGWGGCSRGWWVRRRRWSDGREGFCKPSAWSCVVSKWSAGTAILLGVGERDERRGAFQDAVVVAVDSSFVMADRRMQTAPRWSLALVTLLAWFGGTMMGLALTPDGMVLLQFKAALTNTSSLLEGWNASDPSPCSWGGINCTAAGRVSQIVLTYQVPPLEGHLSASLGELTSLEVLVLDGNLLSGSIPPEIGNLSSLTILSLSFQNFSGEVPLQLFNCRNLVQLWLNWNNFTGDITTALEELSTLPAIEQIGLDGNAFAGTLPPSIGNATSLNYLSMGVESAGCSSGQRGVGYGGQIPKELGKLVNLSTLRLGCNNLSSQIPPDIGNLTLLTTFDLAWNNLSGEIPRSLESLASLNDVWLNNNELSGPIPSYFGNFTGLTSLDLACNNLTGSIPSSLGNLVDLTMLFLFNNSITGPIPSSLENITGLTTLDLAYNNLTGSIPSSLGNLVDLTLLHLFTNSITGPIPASITSLINLQTCLLSYNALTGPIPVNMSKALTSLVWFSVVSNNMSGSVPEDFGRFMPNLTFFEIGNNSFIGTLPDGLCQSGQLTEVAVFNNNLEGPIPPSLGSCSSLQRTLLQYNQFTSIPTGFGRNSALNYLDVSNNQLAGPLPAGLGANSSLAFLDLSANMLTGDMSILEFAQLGKLSSLHLASNSFTGEIPAAMGLCNLLFTVDLSYNSLTGAVPLALANLSTLQELNLQGNNLTAFNAGVYAGWGSTLQTLNLAENPWNAPIEREIGSLRFLQTLNLSYGGRTGPIPPVLGELLHLEVLDLSHNNLTGEVPSALGGMVSLVSVDVSFNGLTGSLPPQWVKFLVANPASFRGNPGLCVQYDTDNVCIRSPGAGGGWWTKLSRRVRVGVGVGVAIWVLGVVVALRFRRRKKPQVEPDIMLEDKITTQNLTKEPLPLTFEQILSAIENMTETQIIGKGSHGVVFRVKCPSDYHYPFIAVKKIQFEDVKPTILHKSFWSEVDTVGQARHRNLVRLLGFLKRDRVGLLVYDYISNGDLYSALHNCNRSLSWKTRLGIARDVARGLAYLHHDHNAPIVHRDIKSSNVLLDDHLEAYISDFGLAKVLDRLSRPKSYQLSTTMNVVGTYGYIAPEVGYSKVVTSKVDVYAYGILMLELLTGKLPVDNFSRDSNRDCSSNDALHLVEWVKAQMHLNPDSKSVVSILDPCLISDAMDVVAIQQMSQLQEIGLLCTHKQPIARPSMRGVEAILDALITLLDDPSIMPVTKEYNYYDGYHGDCPKDGFGRRTVNMS